MSGSSLIRATVAFAKRLPFCLNESLVRGSARKFGLMRLATPELRLSAQRALVGQVSPTLYRIHEEFITVDGPHRRLRTQGTWVLTVEG